MTINILCLLVCVMVWLKRNKHATYVAIMAPTLAFGAYISPLDHLKLRGLQYVVASVIDHARIEVIIRNHARYYICIMP